MNIHVIQVYNCYSDSALESAISQYKREYWDFVTLTPVFGIEGSYMLVYSSSA